MKWSFCNFASMKLLALWVIATSMACQQEQPPVTVERALPQASLTPVVSRVACPIILPLADLEQLINDNLPKVLYKDDSYYNHKEDQLKVLVEKKGKVQIDMEGGMLNYRVPLAVWVQKNILGGKKKPDGIEKEKSLYFTVTLVMSSQVELSTTWQIVSKTSIDSLIWHEKPEIRLAFLKIPLDKLIEQQLQKQQHKLMGKIDRFIYRKVSLKKEIDRIWKDLQQPILVTKLPHPSWLLVTPVSVSTANPVAIEGQLVCYVQIQAWLELVTENNVVEKKSLRKLPDLEILESPVTTYDAFVLCRLALVDANAALRQLLVGQIIAYEGQEITLGHIHVEGSGEYLRVFVQVSGALDGEIYLTGKPVYNPGLAVIHVEDFGYTLETAQWLATAASWLVGGELVKVVQEKLIFSLGEPLDALPGLIESGINRGKSGEKVQVSFARMAVVPQEIAITHDEIQVMVSVKGAGTLQIMR
jgi:hypothetical protein